MEPALPGRNSVPVDGNRREQVSEDFAGTADFDLPPLHWPKFQGRGQVGLAGS